jgi:hypothetical protein
MGLTSGDWLPPHLIQGERNGQIVAKEGRYYDGFPTTDAKEVERRKASGSYVKVIISVARIPKAWMMAVPSASLSPS